MKQFILITLFLAAFQTGHAQFTLDHYHPVELLIKEGIDSCLIFVEDAKGSLSLQQSFSYNEKGQELENRRDYQLFSFTYEYDAKGLKTAEYLVPFNEHYYEKYSHTYNAQGLLIKTVTTDSAGVETGRNEYDYQGTNIREERYILNGDLKVRTLYSYDSKNRLQKNSRYYKGKLDQEWVRGYDENDHLISFTTLAANGTKILEQKFEYNEKGLKVKQSIYQQGDQLDMLFRTYYDEKGFITYEEEITEIKKNNPKKGVYEKTVYRYMPR